MRNQCDTCKKSDICKYKESYQEKYTALTEIDDSLVFDSKINDVLRITLDCKYTEQTSQPRPPFTVGDRLVDDLNNRKKIWEDITDD